MGVNNSTYPNKQTMKYKFLFFITFMTSTVVCHSQAKPCLLIFPNGKLLRTFPYSFSLEDTVNTYVTYNDKPVYKYGNEYVLRPIRDGYFKVFKANNSDTTVLISKQIWVENPPTSVTLRKTGNGHSISRQTLPEAYATVNIYNIDLSLSIPIIEMKISYQKENKRIQSTIHGSVIPKALGEDIAKLGSTYLVLDIVVDLVNEFKMSVPSAIFYLE